MGRKRLKQKWRLSDTAEQKDTIVLITGSNSGIGFEMAMELVGKGAEVILACRHPARAEEAKKRILQRHTEGRIHLVSLDLADLGSIEMAAAEVASSFPRLDVLINNAGVMIPPRGTTNDGFELQVGTNHLGHFALTARLFPLLEKSAAPRVVTVSSIAHTMGRLDLSNMHGKGKRYDKWGQYGRSKLANLMFALELDRRLKASGSHVVSLASHPGYANTSLQRHSLMWRLLNNVALSPQRGAAATVFAATEEEALSHPYWGPVGPLEAWGWTGRANISKRAQHREDARALWTWSEKVTGVRFPV